MNIAVVGTGYVGLVTGACLADFGHEVTCIESDRRRLESVTRGEVPFFEPGLEEMVKRHAATGRLAFSGEMSIVAAAQVVFLAVGTPATATGTADLSQVTAAVEQMIPHLQPGSAIVTKSTVPVGTGAIIRALLRARGRHDEVDVVSNPEFLREGSAIADFMRPDRVVIGTTSERAAAVMREIYRPLYLIETPIVFTSIESAEMIKYASNAFLAVKISFINEVANLCERTGADVHVVAKGMGLDKRIGSKFLHPGAGYGGSCFPKDTRALAAMGAGHGVHLDVVRAAIAANERQRDLVVDKVVAAAGDVTRATIAVLGIAFKPNTSDIRESPAWHLSRALTDRGAHVRTFDPVAVDEARRSLDHGVPERLHFASDVVDAVAGADVLVIATEWNEFRTLDLERIRPLMRRPVVVDVRNVLDPESARAAGFTYIGTGRGTTAGGRVASDVVPAASL